MKGSDRISGKILAMGFPKSGTLYLALLLRDVLQLPLATSGHFDKLHGSGIVHGHWRFHDPKIQLSPIGKAFLVVRDYRDVLVSLYRYHTSRLPHLKDQFPTLLEYFLAERESTPQAWVAYHEQWLMTDVIWTRYEDLLANPLHELQRMMAEAGCPFDQQRAEQAVEANRLEKLKQEKVMTHFHQVDPVHFQQGGWGQWQEALPHQVLQRLIECQPLRQKLGYGDQLQACPRPFHYSGHPMTEPHDEFRELRPLESAESSRFAMIKGFLPPLGGGSFLVIPSLQAGDVLRLAQLGFNDLFGLEPHAGSAATAQGILAAYPGVKASFIHRLDQLPRRNFDFLFLADRLSFPLDPVSLLRQLAPTIRRGVFMVTEGDGPKSLRVEEGKWFRVCGEPSLFFLPDRRAAIKILRECGFPHIAQLMPPFHSVAPWNTLERTVLFAGKTPPSTA